MAVAADNQVIVEQIQLEMERHEKGKVMTVKALAAFYRAFWWKTLDAGDPGRLRAVIF